MECKHIEFTNDDKGLLVCSIGHKPRFYAPKSSNQYFENFGWKRKCTDFEIGDHVQIFNINN